MVTIKGLVLLGKTLLSAIYSDRLHDFLSAIKSSEFTQKGKKKSYHFFKIYFLREGEKTVELNN